jgi:cell division protein FtsN
MKFQRGGFAVGLIVGLLVGLVLALGVALYVTKVPVPFVNKVPQRSAEQDAAEAERNRNWDPNAPLSVKVAPRGVAPASAGSGAPAAATSATPHTPPPGVNAVATPTTAPTASAPAKVLKPGTDPYTYFAQAGAYSRAEDAQAQRAKLALIGLDAKIVEREQSGRTVYRVRLGPFDKRPDAEAMLERLNSASVESSLVRVERQ